MIYHYNKIKHCFKIVLGTWFGIIIGYTIINYNTHKADNVYLLITIFLTYSFVFGTLFFLNNKKYDIEIKSNTVFGFKSYSKSAKINTINLSNEFTIERVWHHFPSLAYKVIQGKNVILISSVGFSRKDIKAIHLQLTQCLNKQ